MFNTMKTISITAFTALALVGAISTPAFADHNGNHQTRQHKGGDNDALVGGAIGAILGGVIGSEVAGSGNGTEGAVVGALVGGIAGAAIADDRSDRRFDRRFDRRSSRSYNSGYYDYDYTYGRNYYGAQSYNRYSSSRFGGRSSFSRRGNSLHSLKKFKKHR